MSFFPAGQGFLAGLAGTVNGNLQVTGRVLTGDGTQAAPAWSFIAEPGAGIRRSGTNAVTQTVNNFDMGSWASAVGTQFTAAAAIQSRLQIDPETVKTANYPATNTDVIVVMNGSGLTLTLPAAPTVPQVLWVRNNDIGSLTVSRNGQSINGVAADLTMLTGTAVMLAFIVGSGWFVVS